MRLQEKHAIGARVVLLDKAKALDAARAAKDFATADALRNELQSAGYVVETTKDGTRVRRG